MAEVVEADQPKVNHVSTKNFFENGITALDTIYNNIRDGQDYPVVRARQFIEREWERASAYIDKRAKAKAKEDLQAVWWELYLTIAFLRIGQQVRPRNERSPRNEGPDLLIDQNIWIEAHMPGNGTGADAIMRPKPFIAFSVPREQMLLRILGAIQGKIEQFRQHAAAGYVKQGDPKIIAISGGRLEYRYQEPHTRWIVQAAYGVSNMVLTIEPGTMKGDVYVEQEQSVLKASGASVLSGVFTLPENSDISAILYSCSDCANFPNGPGDEFVLIHNPFAHNPLPDGWLSVGEEYKLDLKKRAYTRTSHGMFGDVIAPGGKESASHTKK